MSNFWQKLNKPIVALAPMEAVTDVVFREIFARYGKPRTSEAVRGGPDVMFTEFVNVDGLLHPTGFERLKIDLAYTEAQRPIVAQIWGRDPEKFFGAAKIIAAMGFDGIDINFGCPQDKEISQKTCAALIREPELAGEIILATLEGARSQTSHTIEYEKLGVKGGLPVSVKTRLGYSKADEMEGWISHLLKYPIAALSIHARTKQEKSAVPARWEKVAEAVKIRDSLSSKTLIIGNGDIKSREELFARIRDTGCDGVMVARGAFGNPWIFRTDNYQPTVKERLDVMLEHAEGFVSTFKGQKSFVTMRKNFKAYANGFPGAHELRAKLMETTNVEEVRIIVNDFLKGAF